MTTALQGTLSVLHAGAGDVTITFDTPEELRQALEQTAELLKQGFAVLVRQGPKPTDTYARVASVDVQKGDYVLKGKRRGRPPRVAAKGSTAVAVGRSAGG